LKDDFLDILPDSDKLTHTKIKIYLIEDFFFNYVKNIKWMNYVSQLLVNVLYWQDMSGFEKHGF